MQEQLAELPPPALIALGVTLAFIVAVRYLGLWQGQKTPPGKSETKAEVAAVIVDPTALNNATAALVAHTAEVKKTNQILEEAARSLSHMAQELDRIREELRIQRELARR